MQVRDGMSSVILTLGPAHTLREAAARMDERGVGAAVVVDPDAPGPGILTERDVLRAVGRGEDTEAEVVGDHLTSDVVFAEPGWSLEQAAEAMVRGGFRHLIVTDDGAIVGVLSVRDIVRVWTGADARASASDEQRSTSASR